MNNMHFVFLRLSCNLRSDRACFMFFFFFSIFFGLFIDSTAEEGDRKQGERGGSDTQQAGSRTWVRCRAQHMGRLLYQLS